MSEHGQLRDTYVAAIQHGLAGVSGEERLIGVVRRQMPWFRGQVDDNCPALAPPADLLDEFKERCDDLEGHGRSGAAAHNEAWDAVDVEDRYQRYLETSPDAQDAISALEDRLAAGEDLVLVCYENTDEKRCHRTVLKGVIGE